MLENTQKKNPKSMTRTQELQSIGLFRIDDIAEKIQKHKHTVRYRISILGIIPFEKWWYDEAIQRIKNHVGQQKLF